MGNRNWVMGKGKRPRVNGKLENGKGEMGNGKMIKGDMRNGKGQKCFNMGQHPSRGVPKWIIIV